MINPVSYLVQLKQKKFYSLTIIFVAAVFFQSCNTYKNIPYFRNVADSGTVRHGGITEKIAVYNDIIIKPDDILQVSIVTLDPQLGTMGMSTDMEMIQDAGSILTGSGVPANKSIPGYLVDKEGYIELPVSGKVKVGALTTGQARELIKSKASLLYKDPVVNVRLANFRVTVLGEVMRPGTYLVAGERATILDALGMAGDMTIYGKRENVLLVRNEGDHQKMIRFDLNSTETMKSPYYYLRQGDVLYIEPGKGKAASTDASRTRTLALIASALSLMIVLLTRIKF